MLAIALSALLGTASALPALAAGGVNLSWDDCGLYGRSNVTWDCNTNTGTRILLVSFSSPSSGLILGAEVTLKLVANAPVLPEWWEFRSSGACRQNSLSTRVPDGDIFFNCGDLWSTGGFSTASSSYEIGYYGANTARLKGIVSVGPSAPAVLDAGMEYSAQEFMIDYQHTVGIGACPGCDVGMRIEVQSLTLVRLDGSRICITNGLNRNFVTWQNGIPDWPPPTTTITMAVNDTLIEGRACSQDSVVVPAGQPSRPLLGEARVADMGWFVPAAEIGYGPDDSDPITGGTSWHWTPASYSGTECTRASDPYLAYSGTVTVPTEGTYDVCYRFKVGTGEWRYADCRPWHLVAWSHHITASSGPNGSITPSGVVSVAEGGSQTFAIAPAAGYRVADVLVDGASAGSVTEYTFANVTADHTIAATFVALPVLALGDVSVVEGNSGTTTYTFTVTRTGDPAPAVGATYQTLDGTAMAAGNDYISASGPLALAANEMAATITVHVRGDTTYEAHEVFYVRLAGATNAWIGDSVGVGTIRNDDAHPLLHDCYVTNGRVSAVALAPAGDVVYIGGTFTQVGPMTGSWVGMDHTTGLPVAPLPLVSGTVRAAAPDGQGGWYIGGDFTAVMGVPRLQLAHILADGGLSEWDPSANGRVNALAVDGATVYVGGDFTSTGGQARNRIAALDATAGTATPWNPGASSSVYALAVSGSTVYAGGSFSSTGGQPRNRIAALDAATGSAAAWDPNANAEVYALALSGSRIFTGGSFTSVGGQARNNVAALDAATGAATSWNPDANSIVRVLAAVGSTVYAGGWFTNIGGATRNRIAALDAETGSATPWNPNADGYVNALAVSGFTVFAGGSFTRVGGQSRSRLAALDAATGTATAWNPSAGGTVFALGASGPAVYAGGDFSSIGGQPRNRIAALNVATGSATAWDPNADSQVGALAVTGSTVYVGGYFTSIGGQPRNRIAAIDATTGTATAWNPNADNGVIALAVSGATVYAGGWFTTIGGQTRNRIAAIGAATGAATNWNPNADNTVNVLAVSGATVYAGGQFTSIGGQVRNRIAALDATTGNATAWNPNSNSTMNVIAVSGATVYAGGYFTSIGGQTRNRIAALDATTGTATTWDPNADEGVSALALNGSTIFAGGRFGRIGGQTRLRLAALQLATGTALDWNPAAGFDGVTALAVGSGTLYAAGGFPGMADLPQSYFAALRCEAAESVSIDDASAQEGNTGATALTFTVRRNGNTATPLTVQYTTQDGTATVADGSDYVATSGSVEIPASMPSATLVVEVQGDTTYEAHEVFYVRLTGATNAMIADSAGVGTILNDDPHPMLRDFCVADGPVQASALSPGGDVLYIGGQFTRVGPMTGSCVALDGTTGEPHAPIPLVDGVVHAVASDGQGGWYIGGSFTAVMGQGRWGLAHILADGGLSEWSPGTDGTVYALAVSGSTVYVGGAFSGVWDASNHPARANIAALDAVSGTVTAWNPAADGAVYALAVSGATVYAAGSFTTIGGQPRVAIAALDAMTGMASPWNPNAYGWVYALAVNGSVVYAGGDFYNIGGQPRVAIAALDAMTGMASPWNPNAYGWVYALAVSGSTVYAGGNFTSVGGQPRRRIAALDAATGLATTWDPGADSTVRALAVSGSTVYAGGEFTGIGGQGRYRMAALDAATGTAIAWDPNANGTVLALAASGNAICAGGSFTSTGGETRNRIAALDVATGSLTPWNPSASGIVSALAVSGSTVYAGGSFASIGGQPRNRIAALDAATGTATAWNPSANGNVLALAASGPTVYAGGGFLSIGGQPRNRIAALDATTGLATAWDPNASGGVRALAVSGSTVYAGGGFTSIGGQARRRIAALDAATGLATAWDPDADSTVRSLAVSGPTIYAGGLFTAIGGQGRENIAALSAATGSATAWDPRPDGDVYSLAVGGDMLYAGGAFDQLDRNSCLQPGLAALNASSGAFTPWPWFGDTGPDTILTVVTDNANVYIGGSFTGIGALPHARIAAIRAVPSATTGVAATPPAPDRVMLAHGYPNPARSEATIRFGLPRAGPVSLRLYDIAGRVVRVLLDGERPAGWHSVQWNRADARGARVAAGIYFYELRTPGVRLTRKLVALE